MKKFFIAGLITLLPLALTLLITIWLFDLFSDPLLEQAHELISHFNMTHHETLALFLSRVLALLILLAFIVLLGFLTRLFFLNFFIKLADRLFLKIPLIRTIYRVSCDVIKSFFSDGQKTFQRTVLVPFPHHQALAIGFVTSEAPPLLKSLSKADLAVFVPTAPHPMSGFVLLIPKGLTLPTDLTTEEAFKFILSCGVVHPDA